jgi:WD40 repeat protein
MFEINYVGTLSGHTQAIYALSRLNERQFISAGGDGMLVKWDIENFDRGQALAKTPEVIFCTAYHANSHSIICGTMPGGVYWIDLNNERILKNVLHHIGGTYAVLTHGNSVFTAGADGIVTCWDATSLEKKFSIKCSAHGIRCLFITDSMFLYAGDQGGNLISVRLDSGAIEKNATNKKEQSGLSNIKLHSQSLFTIWLDEVQKMIYTGGRDAKLKCLHMKDMNILQSVDAHWFTINRLIELEGTGTIATASRDKTIRIWDKANLKLLHTIKRTDGKGHTHSVNNLIWFASQKLLISCGDDRQIMMYSIE